MKAKLLRDAGKIRRGAEVEIVSKVEEAVEHTGGDPAASDTMSPVYAVKDEQMHEEHVDTRDMKPLP